MTEKIEVVKKRLRNYLSPTFLLLLTLSFMMWYLIKLGHTYTTDVMVPVNVEGTRIRVKCDVKGSGYRIFAHRFLRRSDIKLTLRDVDVTPSVSNEGMLVINPVSLRRAISENTKDLDISAVSEIPEIPAPEAL